MTTDSDALEILVAKIQRQLAPDSEIIHNAHLMGRISKVPRQIDVLVKQKIGQYEMLIVLDCKDHKRPIDVKGVEEFNGLVEDVGAHKGALVCPTGFSSAAKDRARAAQIDLYSPVDTDPHKWQARITAPVLCDFREAKASLRFSSSASMQFRLPQDMRALEVHDPGDRRLLAPPMKAALQRWEEGRYPSDPGEHRDLPIYASAQVLVENGLGQLMPSELSVSLLVERKLFYGRIPIQKLSGFKDELSGAIITNAFTIGLIDPNQVEATWTRIASEAGLPTPVLIRLTGLIGYGGA